MATTGGLPWVKLYTRLLTHMPFQSLPLSQRGVFMYLLMLAGVSSKRGTVFGSDAAIARLIHIRVNLVSSTIQVMSSSNIQMLRRISPHDSSEQGVEIVNWEEFQPKARFLAPSLRIPTESRVTKSRLSVIPITALRDETETERERETTDQIVMTASGVGSASREDAVVARAIVQLRVLTRLDATSEDAEALRSAAHAGVDVLAEIRSWADLGRNDPPRWPHKALQGWLRSSVERIGFAAASRNGHDPWKDIPSVKDQLLARGLSR